MFDAPKQIREEIREYPRNYHGDHREMLQLQQGQKPSSVRFVMSAIPATFEMELSDELKLLAACCAEPVTPQTSAITRHLTAKIKDWPAVVKAARRHQVQGFVQDRLASSHAVPETVRQRWSHVTRQRGRFNLRQAKATAEIHRFLNENSVRNLVLKGLPLASQNFGSLTLKRSSDIDIIVEAQNACEAVKLLTTKGFASTETGRPLDPPQIVRLMRHFKEISLKNSDNIIVDLHWKLIDDHALLRGIEPFRDTRSIALEKFGEVRVLSEANEFVYLCVHGALSNWSRLKWLADVNAYIADWQDSKLAQHLDHARNLGAEPCVLQALVLRSIFWDRPVPTAIMRQTGGLTPSHLINYPLKCMTSSYENGSPANVLRSIRQTALVRTLLYRSRARALSEPRLHLYSLRDVLAVPLPAGLDWLYPVIRPFTWLVRKARG